MVEIKLYAWENQTFQTFFFLLVVGFIVEWNRYFIITQMLVQTGAPWYNKDKISLIAKKKKKKKRTTDLEKFGWTLNKQFFFNLA